MGIPPRRRACLLPDSTPIGVTFGRAPWGRRAARAFDTPPGAPGSLHVAEGAQPLELRVAAARLELLDRARDVDVAGIAADADVEHADRAGRVAAFLELPG